jgi:isopenicillin-N N-acyltransferase-like protein
MGLQHAQQVVHLLPAIQKAIDARFAQLERDHPDTAFESVVQETAALLQAADVAILDFVRGLADGLNLDYERLLHYNLITFLRDILTTRRVLMSHRHDNNPPEDGCSTWAASGAATVDGQPVLVKSRDFEMEHLALQCIVRAEPEKGYRYTYVTSAGSPGVFVAGFNEAGLALVDTHVSSTDVGPGLPTYSLSMHILEEHCTVRGALEYLQSVPRLGRNNLLMVDASGDMALFEIGNQHFAVREGDGILVETNHFVSEVMLPYFVDTEPEILLGNSQARYALLEGQLVGARGRIDLLFAQTLMASHGGSLDSICRHANADSASSTISAMIFLPAQRQMYFCHGMPCSLKYALYGYSQDA